MGINRPLRDGNTVDCFGKLDYNVKDNVTCKREFSERSRCLMKLISWNVNGLRACLSKGFMEFLEQADADVICLQETKM